MKRHLTIILGILLAACSGNVDRQVDDNESPEVLKAEVSVIGERIDGPANIRDAVNGEIIFKLYDDVLVESTPEKNGWHIIAIDPSNPSEDYETNFIKKGTKLTVGGHVVGEVVKDVEVTVGLLGYTHKNNIKKETIIENALKSHFTAINGKRALKDYQSFISKFQLEKDDQFEGYTLYYNYENWIEDPSPMYRIGLVFRKEELIAVLHSRPLDLKGATDNKLDRGFDCLVFNDVADADLIVKQFNHFVNSVD